ncbi:uncharacterized protein LOC122293555 [Carya illinoinensis]|uniref:uncharacterized protein LOC122293555 n=1 Tax=Carya illinoinensis TaxID=32201 RepID=UPI001C72928F|nr:uncharacterized protein LOC122293555 [Carya illinoinensis]
MAPTGRGRGCRRGGGLVKRHAPYQFIGRPRPPILRRWTPDDDEGAGSSDDSTQPPSPDRPPQLASSRPILSGPRSGGNNENLHEAAAEDVSELAAANIASRRPILSGSRSGGNNNQPNEAAAEDVPEPATVNLASRRPILSGPRSGGNNDNLNEPAAEDVLEPTTENIARPRRGRGPAKCIEFDKQRKHGKIPLKINDGQTAPCCENATMFTTRVTWILKHHADMSYPRWTDVPMVEKEELMDRVRADFILDWEKDNHRKTVWKQLRRRFNAFHHELHKKYLSYDSHEEALASAPGMVGPLVWAKLCGRWGSEAFKKMSKQNKENRSKLKINHTAGRKSFVRVLEEKVRFTYILYSNSQSTCLKC